MRLFASILAATALVSVCAGPAPGYAQRPRAPEAHAPLTNAARMRAGFGPAMPRSILQARGGTLNPGGKSPLVLGSCGLWTDRPRTSLPNAQQRADPRYEPDYPGYHPRHAPRHAGRGSPGLHRQASQRVRRVHDGQWQRGLRSWSPSPTPLRPPRLTSTSSPPLKWARIFCTSPLV
ncbi:hypothetical protein B0H15DRAFT_818048 [Mycena belliarum]|uniref:Uncharacterized protein n=1 Tax=Mycena belliarum TaxID=1033014 RepID=A0AAD6UEP8_9AGAR|nr:hypothetical protein B0H15DRAFT_818048 [Mycena belliae]